MSNASFGYMLRLHSFSYGSGIILPGLLKGKFSQDQGQMDSLPSYQLLAIRAFRFASYSDYTCLLYFFFPVVPQHLFSLHCFLCFYCIIALNSQLLFQFHQIFPPALAPGDLPCALCSWIPVGNACSWVWQETLFRLGVVKVGRVVDFSLEMADMEQTP